MSATAELLELTQKFVNEMNKSNAGKHKKEVLAKYDQPEFKRLLQYVYSPFLKFGTTSKGVEKKGGKTQASKRQKVEPIIFTDLFELLDQMVKRELTGDAAIAAVHCFTERYFKHKDLIFKILDKDLKTGASAKSINDVYPKLIEEFNVVLAHPFTDFADRVDFEKDKWYSSRKLDGCRCIIMIDHRGEVKYMSREGNEFFALDNATADIKSLNLKSMVLDCEACILLPDGKDDFKACVSEIKKKNHTIKNPRMCIFDVVTMDEFLQGYSEKLFSERQEDLKKIFASYEGKSLVHLPQTLVESSEQLLELSEAAFARGEEGVILRKNVSYQAKRSPDVLKVKKFNSDEFIVTEVEMGSKQMLRDGKKVEVETLGSVVIDFNGSKVHVGSGFSDPERQKIHANPSCIIGKQILVQYQEITTNKKGGSSMRFPTVRHIYWDPRDT